MSADFATSLCRLVVVTLGSRAGFEKTNSESSALLTDVLARFLLLLTNELKSKAEAQNRLLTSGEDAMALFRALNVDLDDLEHFRREWLVKGASKSEFPRMEPAPFPVGTSL